MFEGAGFASRPTINRLRGARPKRLMAVRQVLEQVPVGGETVRGERC